MDVMDRTDVENIRLTPEAVKMVSNLLEQKQVPDYGLRVFVSGGGCSGMQYGMALEEEPRAYDNIVEQDGVKVFIDPTSMMYLAGSTIDYIDNLMGGGFHIENPNAAATCGCGHSFKTSGQQSAPEASDAGGGCGCA
jgi:iron-sulfur cluster assembly accessory protein